MRMGSPLSVLQGSLTGEVSFVVAREEFNLFVQQHLAQVEAVARGLLTSSETAEEVCVRIFTRARRVAKGWHEPEIELLRRTISICGWARWFGPFTHRGASSGIDGVLSRMPWKLRVLLVLREVGQLSLEDIARVLNRSTESVREGLVQARLRVNEITRGLNEKEK